MNIMDTKTSSKSVNLCWAGMLLIEIAFTVSAFYVATLIMACAGLWHNQARLSYDLIRIFGSTLRGAGRIAKEFGCCKTVVNLAIAVTLEAAQIKLAKAYLRKTASGDEGTLAEGIMILGNFVRIIMYAIPTLFSYSRRLYVWPNEWAFETEYAKLATHCRTWTAFWMFVGLILAIVIMQAFALQKNNLEIVLCLIMVVGLIIVGTSLNDAEPLREALETFAESIERAGQVIFG